MSNIYAFAKAYKGKIKSIQNDRKQFRFSMLLIIFQNAEDLLNK